MAESLGKLEVQLGATVKELIGDLNKSSKSIKSFAKRASSDISKFSKSTTKLKSDLSKLERQIAKTASQAGRKFSKDVKKMGTSSVRASRGIGGLTKSVLNLRSALITTAIVIPAAFAFRKVIKESVLFENSLLDLRKVLNDADGDVRQFIGITDELSTKYGEAAASILQGAATFKQAGFTAAEAFKLQKNALDFVIAGDVEAAAATEILTAALKGFEAPAKDAARFLDVVNEVSNNFATNARELALGMAKLSPIAKTMNITFEETAGILTPIIEVFRSGVEAATALKIGLLSLISDQKPVRNALASIGVAQKDANGHLRSGRDILLDVSKAFETLEQNQKLYITSQIVGERQTGRLIKVFDNLAKSTEITKVALGSAGSIAREVDIRLGALGTALRTLREESNNAARDLGDIFGVSLREVIVDLKDAVKATRAWVAANKEAIQVNVTEFTRGATVMVKQLSAIGSVIRKSFEFFSQAIDVTPTFRITSVEGIESIANDIANVNNVKKFAQQFSDNIDAARILLDPTIELDKDFIEKIPSLTSKDIIDIAAKITDDDNVRRKIEQQIAKNISIIINPKIEKVEAINPLEGGPSIFRAAAAAIKSDLEQAYADLNILSPVKINENALKIIESFKLIASQAKISGSETTEGLTTVQKGFKAMDEALKFGSETAESLGSLFAEMFKGIDPKLLIGNTKKVFEELKAEFIDIAGIVKEFNEESKSLGLFDKKTAIANLNEELAVFEAVMKRKGISEKRFFEFKKAKFAALEKQLNKVSSLERQFIEEKFKIELTGLENAKRILNKRFDAHKAFIGKIIDGELITQQRIAKLRSEGLKDLESKFSKSSGLEESFIETRNRLTLSSVDFAVLQYNKQFDAFEKLNGKLVEGEKITQREINRIRKLGLQEVLKNSIKTIKRLETMEEASRRQRKEIGTTPGRSRSTERKMILDIDDSVTNISDRLRDARESLTNAAMSARTMSDELTTVKDRFKETTEIANTQMGELTNVVKERFKETTQIAGTEMGKLGIIIENDLKDMVSTGDSSFAKIESSFRVMVNKMLTTVRISAKASVKTKKNISSANVLGTTGFVGPPSPFAESDVRMPKTTSFPIANDDMGIGLDERIKVGRSEIEKLDINFTIVNNTGVEFESEVGVITKSADKIVGEIILNKIKNSRTFRDEGGF